MIVVLVCRPRFFVRFSMFCTPVNFATFVVLPQGHHRCGGNHALPDTVDVWQAERESFRVKRFISFGVAPLPDTCSRSTILENVYGGRDRAPLIGTAPEDAKWPKARTLFKPTTWHEHSENETSEKTDL